MSYIYNTFIVLFEYLDLYFRSELLKRYWIALFLYSLTIPSVCAQSVLSEYVRCLDEGEDPIEYVFNLFETSDVVILGERDHRDVTQYELINKLIADHRFAERIGYVYTEVGVVNMTERANKLIKGIFRTDDEYKKAKLDYLRDEDYNFCWEKTNRSYFIDNLYCVNSQLPNEIKITLGLTDVEFDWYKAKSPAKYRKWYYKYTVADSEGKNDVRDKSMAKNFIKQYKRQKPINGCRKALLITNQPHAINNKSAKNEGYIIKKELGNDKVKIVCLNWVDFFNFSGPRELIDQGKWDAAFEITECKPFGFSINDTPFGKTTYNNWWADNGTIWQDYMDGIIYYEPFYKFKASIGVEGFMDDSCKEEQMRRLRLNEVVSYDVDYESYKKYFNTVRTFPCEDVDALNKKKEQINRLISIHKNGMK